MCSHLWFLTSEATSLAISDDKVSSKIKIKMVEALQSRDIESEANKRIILKPNEVYEYANKDNNDIISIQSRHFFNRFGIPMDFLDLDPKLWNENDKYIKDKQLVNNIYDDIAERGVKLIEDYYKLLSKTKTRSNIYGKESVSIVSNFQIVNKSTLFKNY